MPRVAACEYLHQVEGGGQLPSEAVFNLVKWVTGSEAQAAEAAGIRASARQAAGKENP